MKAVTYSAPHGAKRDLVEGALTLANRIHVLRATAEAAHAALLGPRPGDVDVVTLFEAIADGLTDLEPIADRLRFAP